MGALIIIVLSFIGFIVFEVFGVGKDAAKSSNSSSSSSSYFNTSKVNSLQIKAEKNKIEEWDVLQVFVKGTVKLPNYYSNVFAFRLNITDITDGDDFVICSLKEFQYDDAPIFLYVSKSIPVNFQNVEWKDWASVIAVPIDSLVFPYKGFRKLKFKIEILTAQNSSLQVVKEIEVVKNFTINNTGYKEKSENKIKYKKHLVELLLEVANIDGKIESTELRSIENSIANKLATNEEEKENLIKVYKEKKNKMQRYTGDGTTRINNICKKLLEVTEKSDINQVMEMVLDVVVGDGVLDKNEEEIIETISNKLKFDVDQFRKIKQRMIPVNILSDEQKSNNSLIIDPLWTIDEKKKYLRGEYKKWNSLTASNDKSTREQAKNMLILIATERSKL
jgi:uncharacterized tellurite resistance protein B-like protein